MNNKGQTLVLFVLILPIIIFIMLLVIDVSNMFITKQELNNINKIVLNYGLDIIEEENIDSKLEELINKNVLNNEHTIRIDNGIIEIDLKRKRNIIRFNEVFIIVIFIIKYSNQLDIYHIQQLLLQSYHFLFQIPFEFAQLEGRSLKQLF